MATPTTPLTTDNPYGLEQLWAQGDFVAKGTLILLLIMSALSWWVMITKAWDQRRLRSQAKQAERDFWSAGSLKKAIDTLKGKDNAFRYIAEEGMRATQHHEGRLTDQVDRTNGSRRLCSVRSTASPTTCRAACRSWRPSAPPRHSSDCSARCGASITR